MIESYQGVSFDEKLRAKVTVDQMTGCWVPLVEKMSFGATRSLRPEQVAWALYRGEEPLHRVRICETEGCANFRHYETAEKTCMKGHPCNPSNVMIWKTRETCATCHEANKKCGKGHLLSEVGFSDNGKKQICLLCYRRRYTRCLKPELHDLLAEDAVTVSARKYVDSHGEKVLCCVKCLFEQECTKGHVMSEDNTAISAAGKRLCIACVRRVDDYDKCGQGHDLTAEGSFKFREGGIGKRCLVCDRENHANVPQYVNDLRNKERRTYRRSSKIFRDSDNKRRRALTRRSRDSATVKG